MNNTYNPPYTLTDEMFDLVSQIMENLGKLNGVDDLEKLPRLRRINRIKSIHSSLAIENNTLSIEQVSDVINGKKVLGPQKDIIEVHNAFNAYEEVSKIDPYSIKDLLKIHSIMTNGLVKESGMFRSGQVGVYDQDGNVIHIAPPANIVPSLIKQLFDWVKSTNINMLIKSSIFHYEFEFIHPFNDGNGRTGRLWQTAMLASWKPIFEWIPIESIIKDNQDEYYKTIVVSTEQGESTAFITFMLKAISTAINNIIIDSKNHYNHSNNRVSKLMNVLDYYPQSANELMEKLNLKSRVGFRKNYLEPAIELGLVGMTNPDKPTSKNQKYYKV